MTNTLTPPPVFAAPLLIVVALFAIALIVIVVSHVHDTIGLTRSRRAALAARAARLAVLRDEKDKRTDKRLARERAYWQQREIDARATVERFNANPSLKTSMPITYRNALIRANMK